ncbi:MAG TPA: ABC transporter permease [Methanocella sp.]|nr:ABC transporter permease [Methanocella sp.]
MAVSEKTVVDKPGAKGVIGSWMERNDSRIKDVRYSVKLFMKSPLAVLGALIVILFILMAILAPFIAPYGAKQFDFANPKKAPSAQHLLGTDDNGGDMFSRIIWGSQVSLEIGLIVVCSAVILGSIIGGISGYFGGLIDEIMMRVTDIFLAFPQLVLAMVICAALGRSIENVMLALTITWWSTYARIIRGQALTIRESKYIEAARAIGGSDIHIIRKHLLPNSLSPIIVQATMDLGNVILTAAGLSFIGFGAQPGDAEWGRMISDGSRFMMHYPWIVTFTGLAILIVCLGFNLFGDGLRDVMDPKMRR